MLLDGKSGSTWSKSTALTGGRNRAPRYVVSPKDSSKRAFNLQRRLQVGLLSVGPRLGLFDESDQGNHLDRPTNMLPKYAGCDVLLVGLGNRRVRADEIFSEDKVGNRPILLLGALAGSAIVPFVLNDHIICEDCGGSINCPAGYRHQQIPPTQVITGLAIVLTVSS